MTSIYLFNKGNRTNTMAMQKNAISIIQAFFAKHFALVGTPHFLVNPDKAIIQLFYFSSSTEKSLSDNHIIALGNALTLC